MKPPRRVALYSRVSTALQASDGISLEQQERAIREHCARQGWPEPVPYVDAGRSAYKEAIRSRPMFAKLLADVAAGTIDAVVIWHLNRWARRVRIAHETIDLLTKAGVPLISLAQQLDYSSAVGKLTFTLLAGVAEFESDEKSESSKRTHAELKAQGRWSGGEPPFGAMLDADGRLTLNPAKAPALARLLTLAAEHGDGLVADTLTAAAIPAPGAHRRYTRRDPSHWWPRTVNKIVRDGAWLATQPDPWPALWLAAASRPKRPPTGKARATHTLTGLLRCGRCGGPVCYHGKAMSKAAPQRLRCQRPGCRAMHGYAPPHEQAVIAAAMALTPRPAPDDRPGIDVVAWAALAEERRRVNAMYRRGEINDAEYDADLADLDARAAALTAAATPARDLGDMAAYLLVLDVDAPEEQNAHLRDLIDRVVLDGKARRIVWLPEAQAQFDGCA